MARVRTRPKLQTIRLRLTANEADLRLVPLRTPGPLPSGNVQLLLFDWSELKGGRTWSTSRAQDAVWVAASG
jgi:hypothetical protein